MSNAIINLNLSIFPYIILSAVVLLHLLSFFPAANFGKFSFGLQSITKLEGIGGEGI